MDQLIQIILIIARFVIPVNDVEYKSIPVELLYHEFETEAYIPIYDEYNSGDTISVMFDIHLDGYIKIDPRIKGSELVIVR